MQNITNSFITLTSEGSNSELVPNLVKGMFDLQNVLMNILVYPLFTILFFLLVVAMMIIFGLSVKKYLQMNVMGALKLFALSVLLSLITIDVYLIAFGKTTILLLYLKLQKDILFISFAFFIGFICGKILLDDKKKREVLP